MVILLDGETESSNQVVVRADLEGAIAVVGVGVNPDFIVEQLDREGLGLGGPRQVDARGLE